MITRQARRVWNRFGLPHTADEVVDALFSLPDSQLMESRAGAIERPKWFVAHGLVFGHLVMIGGRKDAATGEWIAVQHIAVVGTIGGEHHED